MATKQENAVKHEANVVQMKAQLNTWSLQLDDLVVGSLHAGAQSNDAYRVRIDNLRTRHGAAQTKIDEYNNPPGNGQTWGAFRAGIKDDWTALEDGFKDLTH